MSITHAELADLVVAEPAAEPSTIDEPVTVATAEPSTAEPGTHDAGGADAGGTPPQLPAASADVALKSKLSRRKRAFDGYFGVKLNKSEKARAAGKLCVANITLPGQTVMISIGAYETSRQAAEAYDAIARMLPEDEFPSEWLNFGREPPHAVQDGNNAPSSKAINRVNDFLSGDQSATTRKSAKTPQQRHLSDRIRLLQAKRAREEEEGEEQDDDNETIDVVQHRVHTSDSRSDDSSPQLSPAQPPPPRTREQQPQRRRPQLKNPKEPRRPTQHSSQPPQPPQPPPSQQQAQQPMFPPGWSGYYPPAMGLPLYQPPPQPPYAQPPPPPFYAPPPLQPPYAQLPLQQQQQQQQQLYAQPQQPQFYGYWPPPSAMGGPSGSSELPAAGLTRPAKQRCNVSLCRQLAEIAIMFTNKTNWEESIDALQNYLHAHELPDDVKAAAVRRAPAEHQPLMRMLVAYETLDAAGQMERPNVALPWWHAALLKALAASEPGRTFSAVLDLMNIETGVEALELLKYTTGVPLSPFGLILLKAVASTTKLGDKADQRMFQTRSDDIQKDPSLLDVFLKSMKP